MNSERLAFLIVKGYFKKAVEVLKEETFKGWSSDQLKHVIKAAIKAKNKGVTTYI